MLKKFGKDLVIYGISSSLGKFVMLLLVPLYTRIFNPEVYGAMDLIATIVAISAIFGMLQLESAVSRYYYAEKSEINRSRMISTALWSILFLSLLFLLSISLFSNAISTQFFKSTVFSNTIIVASFTIPLANLNSLLTVIIRFKKKPFHYMLFQLLQIGITVGLTIFLTINQKIGISGVFWGQVAGYALVNLLMSIYLRHHLAFTWSGSELKKMLRFSLPIVPAVAGGWANSYMNRFIMLGYLSVTEIGLYAVALKIASVFQLIGSAFRMAWGPFFWETYENDPNHREVFKKIQQMLSTFALILVIMITLFSNNIVQLLTSESYFIASQLVGMLALSIAIDNIIMQVTGIGPAITKKTEYNTIIYLLSLPVNIGALFLLVPRFGVIGVPISLLLGNLTCMVVDWYNSERLYYVGFKKLPMFVNMMITFIIIVINLCFDLPLYFKILIMLSLSVYLFAKYRTKIISLFQNRAIF